MATSHGGAKYFLTFIDDFSRKKLFYTMKTKFGVFDKLKVFNALVENQTRKKIKVIRCEEVGSITLRISIHFARKWHCEANNHLIHIKAKWCN
jgi:hypothetical protein